MRLTAAAAVSPNRAPRRARGILNAEDIIVKVGLTTTCGSDLRLLGGYIPAMRAGDVLGHEFMRRSSKPAPGCASTRPVTGSWSPRSSPAAGAGTARSSWPEILDLMARGDVTTSHLATNVMPLDQASEGYRMFKEEDGCVGPCSGRGA